MGSLSRLQVIEESQKLLLKSGKLIIKDHSRRVADTAKNLAIIYGENTESAEIAGYIHDISGVFSNEKKLEYAREHNIDILNEEKAFPILIHQKISKEMAKTIFYIEDDDILNAVECHTTLRANPSKLDMILFIADKISWDQDGEPPYLSIIEEGLEKSLDDGVYAFLDYTWRNKDKLLIVHPWLEESYVYFRDKLL